MKRELTALLLVLALAGYADLTGSCGATSETMRPANNDESAAMPQFRPDLDPGSPYGFGPEVLRTPRSPSLHNGP
jgi:hypothetical protein